MMYPVRRPTTTGRPGSTGVRTPASGGPSRVRYITHPPPPRARHPQPAPRPTPPSPRRPLAALPPGQERCPFLEPHHHTHVANDDNHQHPPHRHSDDYPHNHNNDLVHDSHDDHRDHDSDDS